MQIYSFPHNPAHLEEPWNLLRPSDGGPTSLCVLEVDVDLSEEPNLLQQIDFHETGERAAHCCFLTPTKGIRISINGAEMRKLYDTLRMLYEDSEGAAECAPSLPPQSG